MQLLSLHVGAKHSQQGVKIYPCRNQKECFAHGCANEKTKQLNLKEECKIHPQLLADR